VLDHKGPVRSKRRGSEFKCIEILHQRMRHNCEVCAELVGGMLKRKAVLTDGIQHQGPVGTKILGRVLKRVAVLTDGCCNCDAIAPGRLREMLQRRAVEPYRRLDHLIDCAVILRGAHMLNCSWVLPQRDNDQLTIVKERGAHMLNCSWVLPQRE